MKGYNRAILAGIAILGSCLPDHAIAAESCCLAGYISSVVQDIDGQGVATESGRIGGVLEESIPVVFRLKDGVKFDGKLTEWNADGFDGSFGQRKWLELRTDDAWKLYRRVMHDDNIEHWLNLGRLMVLHGSEGDRFAEHAYRRAEMLNVEGGQEKISAARDAAIEEKEANESAREIAAENALRHNSPEAQQWTHAPWPTLDRQMQVIAVQTLQADAKDILADVGLELEAIVADYVMVYSDLPRLDAAKIAVELDKKYKKIARLLTDDERENVFWGKAVVFIFSERDTFELVEVGRFKQLLPQSQTAITHYEGPKVFINAEMTGESDDVTMAIVAQLTHGILHRLGSPKRLPAWANEGLAAYFEQQFANESPIHEGVHPEGVRLVRQGVSPAHAFELTYELHPESGRNLSRDALGYLMIKYLIDREPQRLKDWVHAVKEMPAEKDIEVWMTLFENALHATPQELATATARFFNVND